MLDYLRLAFFSHLLTMAGSLMNTYTLEVLAPVNCTSFYSSAVAEVAAELAVGAINASAPPIIPAGVSLALRVRETQCSPPKELLAVAALTLDADLDAILGPAHWMTCDPAARLARARDVPITSWSCTDTRLTDHKAYPSFTRMSVSDSSTAEAFRAIMADFGWKYTAIIAVGDPQWTVLGQEIKSSLNAEGFVVEQFLTVSDGATDEELKTALKKVSSPVKDVYLQDIDCSLEAMQVHGGQCFYNRLGCKGKSIILCMPSPALGSEDQNNLLLAASDLGMTAGSFAFFLVSTLFGVRLDTKDWFRPDRTGLDQLRAAYEAAFVMTVQPGGLGAQYGEGMDRFYKILEEEPFASKVKGHQVSTLFGYVYDSVYLYAIAVGSTWATVKPSPTAVWTAMRNLTFEGISGNVTIDAEGARLFDFVLLDYKRDSQRFGVVRTIERVFDQNGGTASGRYVVQEWTGSEIEWPGGAVLAPDEQCILDGTVCPTSVPDGPVVSTIIAGVGGALGVCLAISVAIAFFIIVRRRMLKKEMASGLNKVLMTDGDLMFERSPGEFGSLHGIPDGRRTRGSQQTLKERSVHSAHRRESVPLKTEANKQYKVARYNGELVFVKNIRKSSFEMKSSLLRQMKLVRDLRHENLNPFVGCYTEPGDYYWVYHYCTRLSLRDIYSNENLKLDWTFKSSLLVDLVSGMRYLHNSPIKQHGRLTSSNCVIDSRWVLKVTDYGIPAMLSTQSQSEDIEQEPEELLWTAPELLRDPILRRTGTPKGDFYSFGIILSEVLTRAEPFSMLSINPKEIVAKVRKPPPLCRPSVSQNEAPREVIEIMKQCWSEMPDMRLDFVFIYQELKKLNRGRRANIVDSMFKMLEKYSNHLEDLIRERTAELDEEKAKTDMLLNRMLPPSVAAELKAGRTVPPVNYSSVTIFFSDIVGFTNISAQSTAFQVVDFLNDLYTAFDDTLTYHDVYKVETIGDAYMVASGLPITNGNRHAGEIANLALDLLHVAGFEFTIRHMPDKSLRLRIGIHSGQCAAGVVGLAMPRYCLFGDTVNTASRMESNGMAFRIHVSQPTLNILEELGGYHVHLRGDIYLKGKGMARTYWLTGRDGFTKQLPDWKSAVEPEAPTPGVVPDPPSTIVTSTINSNTSDAPPTGSLLQGGLGQRVGSVSSLLTVPDGGCSDIEIEPDDSSSLSNDEGVLSTEAMSTSFYSRTKDFFSNFPGSRPGSGNSLANPSSRPSSRPGSAIDPSSRPTSRVSSRMSNFLNSRPSSRSPSPAPGCSASPKPRAVHIVITDSDVSTNVTASA